MGRILMKIASRRLEGVGQIAKPKTGRGQIFALKFMRRARATRVGRAGHRGVKYGLLIRYGSVYLHLPM